MNKKELLQKIKNELAEKHSYPSWSAVIKYPMDAETRSKMFDEVANRYAIACCEDQKREIANIVSGGVGTLHEVLKKAILETKNVAE